MVVKGLAAQPLGAVHGVTHPCRKARRGQGRHLIPHLEHQVINATGRQLFVHGTVEVPGEGRVLRLGKVLLGDGQHQGIRGVGGVLHPVGQGGDEGRLVILAQPGQETLIGPQEQFQLRFAHDQGAHGLIGHHQLHPVIGHHGGGVGGGVGGCHGGGGTAAAGETAAGPALAALEGDFLFIGGQVARAVPGHDGSRGKGIRLGGGEGQPPHAFAHFRNGIPAGAAVHGQAVNAAHRIRGGDGQGEVCSRGGLHQGRGGIQPEGDILGGGGHLARPIQHHKGQGIGALLLGGEGVARQGHGSAAVIAHRPGPALGQLHVAGEGKGGGRGQPGTVQHLVAGRLEGQRRGFLPGGDLLHVYEQARAPVQGALGGDPHGAAAGGKHAGVRGQLHAAELGRATGKNNDVPGEQIDGAARGCQGQQPFQGSVDRAAAVRVSHPGLLADGGLRGEVQAHRIGRGGGQGLAVAIHHIEAQGICPGGRGGVPVTHQGHGRGIVHADGIVPVRVGYAAEDEGGRRVGKGIGSVVHGGHQQLRFREHLRLFRGDGCDFRSRRSRGFRSRLCGGRGRGFHSRLRGGRGCGIRGRFRGGRGRGDRARPR